MDPAERVRALGLVPLPDGAERSETLARRYRCCASSSAAARPSALCARSVEVTDTHVLVDGRPGEYSLHLGSAVVHRRPGGSLCIVPVGSQYRGRMFLPFADHDPKTAELVSKVLLLAEDHKIKDPTILEQLRD